MNLFKRRSKETQNNIREEIKEKTFLRGYAIKTLLFFVFLIAFTAHLRHNTNAEFNLMAGYLGVTLLILVLAVLVLPDGPLFRPHPILWRLVLGLSFVYVITSVFILFQNYLTIKSIIVWIFPRLKFADNCPECIFKKPYDRICDDYSLKNLAQFDIYSIGHLIGWIVKALFIRNSMICWLFSVTWEVTEIAFSHIVPLNECWWDSIFLDIILTNGIGIFIGMCIIRLFNLDTYHWDIYSDEQFINREVCQSLIRLSPNAQNIVKSFEQTETYVRVFWISLFNIFWQMTELNTFLQMRIFEFPADHPLLLARYAFIAILCAPTAKEYALFLERAHTNRLGTFTIMFGFIAIIDIIVNITFEPQIITNLLVWNLIVWFITQLFLSIIYVVFSIYWSKLRTKPIEPDTCIDTCADKV